VTRLRVSGAYPYPVTLRFIAILLTVSALAVVPALAPTVALATSRDVPSAGNARSAATSKNVAIARNAAAARNARNIATARDAAATRNVAATKAYINANYALVRVARSHLAEGKAAIKSLANQIIQECPGAAFESPQDHDSEQLSNEVVGALEVAAYRPDVASMRSFAHAVAGLHWSNHALTRTVSAYATKLKGFATLAMPDVCGDVKAWAASGYLTLPATTLQFDQSYYAFDLEAEEVPLRLLAPYESATGASLLHRTKRLEAPLAEAEADAVFDYTHILDSLKLSQ
jgi:hypothetical protein